MQQPDSMNKLLKSLLAPRRNAYFYGKLMDVSHFQMEQDYLNAMRWMLNRLTLGTGILCGLRVTARENQVCITRGVAIDGLGREVIVPGEVCLDPWRLSGACGPQTVLDRQKPHMVEISLCYDECPADAQPVLAASCNTGDLCEPGTIVEGFRLDVCEAGEAAPTTGPDVCAALFGEGQAAGTAGGYRVVATIETGGAPLAVVVHPKTPRAVVISQENPGRAWVIDVDQAVVIHTFTGLPGTPAGVAVAKDGGPVFVTSDQGVTRLDVTSTPPKLIDSFLPDNPYSACAAAFGGKVLFAINTRTTQLDRIEGKNVAKSIQAGKRPNLLDITPDEKLLAVSDPLERELLWVDVSAFQVVKTANTTLSLNAVAARVAGGARDALFGSNGRGVALSEAGGTAVHTLADCDVKGLDFTSDGSRVYAVNNNGDTGAHQVVIYSTGAALSEIARLEVGSSPLGIAVVPGRLRALVANRGSDSVSVIDVEDHRRQDLCEALVGDCCPPERECVTLARVELLENGTIGKVETCLAPVVYSNAALFEMILCLAERVEQCCSQPAPQPNPDPGPGPDPKPDPDPDPTPDPDPKPDAKPLQVQSVEFLNLTGKVVGRYKPDQEMVIKAGSKLASIRVTFANQAFAPKTLIAGDFGDAPEKSTFLVVGSWSNLPGSMVPGKLAFSKNDTVAEFTIHPEFKIFRKGEHALVLFGKPNKAGDLILAVDGSALDGEPVGLPSGDGAAGGTFELKFLYEGD